VSEDGSTQRLSVVEAAEVLGVTRDAIHKRIKRGSIQHDRGEDGRLYVYVYPSTKSLDTSVDKSKDESKVESLERLIESQQDQIGYLRDQLDQEREANRENRRIIAGLTQRIPEIEAPQDPPRDGPGSPTRASESAPSAEAHAEAETGGERRRSWWREFFGFGE
jgi:predicted DNA-binding protein YlxM (UPF0122 family)